MLIGYYKGSAVSMHGEFQTGEALQDPGLSGTVNMWIVLSNFLHIFHRV